MKQFVINFRALGTLKIKAVDEDSAVDLLYDNLPPGFNVLEVDHIEIDSVKEVVDEQA